MSRNAISSTLFRVGMLFALIPRTRRAARVMVLTKVSHEACRKIPIDSFICFIGCSHGAMPLSSEGIPPLDLARWSAELPQVEKAGF